MVDFNMIVVVQMLAKKVDTLTKAMEVEAKKMRREVAAMEKEVAAMRVEKEHENRAKRFGSSKGSVNSSLLAGRYSLISPISTLTVLVIRFVSFITMTSFYLLATV